MAQLTQPSRVLGDIRDPELVQSGGSERAAHEIVREHHRAGLRMPPSLRLVKASRPAEAIKQATRLRLTGRPSPRRTLR